MKCHTVTPTGCVAILLKCVLPEKKKKKKKKKANKEQKTLPLKAILQLVKMNRCSISA